MAASMSTTASPPPMTELHGAALYDALYATGYHSMSNTSRAHDVIAYFGNTSHMALRGVHSVLDVGCSHGFAVGKLWEMGYTASGVDISVIAVDKARKLRGEPKNQCIPPCFAQGPATAIPHASASFDAIMSTDVLEHVEAADVQSAIHELSRVARKLLILKIATRGDAVDYKQIHAFDALKKLNQSELAGTRLPGNLHPTVHGPAWWSGQFREIGGWQHVYTFPYPHGRPWLCCTVVMRRNENYAASNRDDRGDDSKLLGATSTK